MSCPFHVVIISQPYPTSPEIAFDNGELFFGNQRHAIVVTSTLTQLAIFGVKRDLLILLTIAVPSSLMSCATDVSFVRIL